MLVRHENGVFHLHWTISNRQSALTEVYHKWRVCKASATLQVCSYACWFLEWLPLLLPQRWKAHWRTPLDVLKRKRSKVHGGGRFLTSVKGAKFLCVCVDYLSITTHLKLTFLRKTFCLKSTKIFFISVSPCEECE